jgi:6-pyruvoyltetrahydropterin/6-carboxytetrahydropterin synthase
MLQSDGYVVDFGVVKKSVRAVCKSLNERVIIPTNSDVISIYSTTENEVRKGGTEG